MSIQSLRRVLIAVLILCPLAAAVARPAAICAAEPADGPTALRVYYIGNSVTDTVRYAALEKMAAEAGKRIVWGRHMIPGAPLSWLWEHGELKDGKADGFVERPFGPCRVALREHAWDVVTLQPFDRRLQSGGSKPEGDLDIAQAMIDLAAARNPNVRIYIYSRWPRMTRQGKGLAYDRNAFNENNPFSYRQVAPIDDFSERWNARFNPEGWDLTNESREYFEKLTEALRERNPKLAHPVCLIPVGDVMNELHGLMKSGKAPGYDSIYAVYKDAIHLNDVGSYIVGCTFYAVLFGESPEGRGAELYNVRDKALAELIARTAWRVVKEHRLGGRAEPSSH